MHIKALGNIYIPNLKSHCAGVDNKWTMEL
uniref:Uncharacterized protein n=1 Tax=Anguilla anguilla TaxID=7936 RepID=A0A0E9UV92_ANGAN